MATGLADMDVKEQDQITASGIVIPKIALAQIPRGTITTSLVSKMGEIFGKTGFLSAYNVEREEEIELVWLSLLAGLDPLLLGPPGTGKTWLLEGTLMALRIPPELLFNTMVFKESSADDILGPRSLMALKRDQIDRMMDGFAPTAVLAYLDEIFKASPTMANALLDLYAQRKVKIGRNVYRARQLLSIFHSSNELTDREDMTAFRDRIGLTKHVKTVQSPDNRKRVLKIQDEVQAGGGEVDLSNVPILTLDEIFMARAEVVRIPMSDAAVETLDKIVERCTSAGHEPSSRRVGLGQLAMKAMAWTRGDDHVKTDHCIVLQHMFWNDEDDFTSAREIVMEFANVFARKANRMREALEPITTALEDVKKEMAGGEPTDEQMEAAFTVMRDLGRMRKEVKVEIDAGEQQGHDVSDLDKILQEINRSHNWIKQTVAGDEE